MDVTPYLFLDGRCEEAIAFYQTALGAKVTRSMRFRDNPDKQHGKAPPDSDDKIMHAHVTVGNSAILMSDGHCTGKPVFQGFALSLAVESDAKAETIFAALSDGGQAQMPMTTTFFASRFGMVADKFGVSWMVMTESPMQKS